jgi:hypothetical protein
LWPNTISSILILPSLRKRIFNGVVICTSFDTKCVNEDKAH